MPIHCSDLTDIIYHVIERDVETKIIECVGPEIMTFKRITKKLFSINKKIVSPFPLLIAKLSAKFFELFHHLYYTRSA